MGALFLNVLDRRMEDIGVFYVRFMDDWVILAPTRWKLRKAIRIVNQTLAEQQVQQHPDKTFIGRVNRGFSFLGYEFNATGLTGVALQTRTRFIERVNQLYERGAMVSRIGAASCSELLTAGAHEKRGGPSGPAPTRNKASSRTNA